MIPVIGRESKTTVRELDAFILEIPGIFLRYNFEESISL